MHLRYMKRTKRTKKKRVHLTDPVVQKQDEQSRRVTGPGGESIPDAALKGFGRLAARGAVGLFDRVFDTIGERAAAEKKTKHSRCKMKNR